MAHSIDDLSTVGVIILTKNEELNIRNCIKSVQKQIGCNFKIFISDNRSTDNTLNVIYDLKTFTMENNLRVENECNLSVYQHSYNAIKYYSDKNPKIPFWINLGADDEWESETFLKEILDTSKNNSINESREYCIYPRTKVINHNNRRVFYYTPRILSKIPVVKVLSFFLIPRTKQPFSIYYGLYNRPALLPLLEYLINTEKYRLKSLFLKDRVPEAETFYALQLLSKIHYVVSRNSVLCLSIGNRRRKINPTNKQFNSVLFKYIGIIFKSKYIFSYYWAFKKEMPRSIFFFVTMAILPKFFIELIFDMYELIKLKLKLV